MENAKIETAADQLTKEQVANVAELIASIGEDPTFTGHDTATC